MLYLKTERFSNNVGGERSHNLAIVCHAMEKTSKRRDGARGDFFGKESEDSKHSKTPVVDLSYQTLGLLVFRHVLGKLERIVEVERNRVRDTFRTSEEIREITRLSSSHVVLVATNRKLRPDLKKSDQTEDLPLSIIRNSVPKGRRVSLRRERSSVHLHGPWELDSVSMDNVSNEGKHSNTSMLDLGMTKESDGSFVASTPELSLGEVERIEEANKWV
mmetsp:Transcript_10005/g.16761  ORF Transcript_10005/g.16761 Transcript_10005/m.16761 type:complete len:218 (-) Transcript_10005:194-847(-)